MDAVVTFVEVHDHQHQQEEVRIDMVDKELDATTTMIILIWCIACITHIDYEDSAQTEVWLLKIVDHVDKNIGSNLKITIPQKFVKNDKKKNNEMNMMKSIIRS